MDLLSLGTSAFRGFAVSISALKGSNDITIGECLGSKIISFTKHKVTLIAQLKI